MKCQCGFCGGKGSICSIEKAKPRNNIKVLIAVNINTLPPIVPVCAPCRQEYRIRIK